MDILDPSIFVNAEMLADSVEGDETGAGQGGVDDLFGKGGGEMNREDKIKEAITDKGKKSSIEARIIAEKRSGGVNRIYGGNSLEKKEEK